MKREMRTLAVRDVGDVAALDAESAQLSGLIQCRGVIALHYH